jgi:hypothetical protein
MATSTVSDIDSRTMRANHAVSDPIVISIQQNDKSEPCGNKFNLLLMHHFCPLSRLASAWLEQICMHVYLPRQQPTNAQMKLKLLSALPRPPTKVHTRTRAHTHTLTHRTYAPNDGPRRP